jgi:lipoate-protein ligase A
LTTNARALEPVIGKRIEIAGFTDLAADGLKFSGNAQRRGHRWLLFHGCFMLDLDLALMETVLRVPRRQPAYRNNRSHREFLVNLEISSEKIKGALMKGWGATESFVDLPLDRIGSLARRGYRP